MSDEKRTPAEVVTALVITVHANGLESPKTHEAGMALCKRLAFAESEVATLISAGLSNAAHIKRLESERDALAAKLADHESAYRATLNSPCDDERHCTCVPHLRRKIGELEAENAGLRKKSEEATRAVAAQYLAGIRKGWEEGPTESEADDEAVNFLCNYGEFGHSAKRSAIRILRLSTTECPAPAEAEAENGGGER